NPGVSDAEDVRKRIARIRAEHYPARVRIVANVQDAAVVIDGEDKGAALALELAPGKHRVDVRGAGRDTAPQAGALAGDEDTPLRVTLGETRVDVATPPPPPPPRANGTWRTMGWIAGATGVAVLGVSLVVDLAALGPKISDYRDAADRGDPSARALR